MRDAKRRPAVSRTAAHTATVLAASFLVASSAQAQTLTVDGQSSILAPVGSDVTIELDATPGLPFLLLVDVSPGPVTLFGQSAELGFTSSFLVATSGAIPDPSPFSTTFAVSSNPAFDGLSLYFLGVVVDALAPEPIQFSNGISYTHVVPTTFTEVDLAGEPLLRTPFFDAVRAFNEGEPLDVAVEPNRFPLIAGKTADVYVVNAKTAAEWDLDASLTDVTSDGADTFEFTGPDIRDNTLTVDPGSLSGAAGPGLGVGYDVVVDLNQNGTLDAGDFIDGYGDEAGLYIVHDTTLPGPYAVTEATYSGGSFLGQNLFYPSNISTLGVLPLLIVSHGNGHNYQWYDHIGNHLASYGIVVMSHQNNTIPGIETSSTTTLTNTDFFLGNLATIQGGVLNGHVDVNNIGWIGHSRGGEGVARAYDRIIDGTYVPSNFTADDITCISSIAPTDFLGTNSANPHGVDYHLWVGGSDADVSGCSSSNVTQSFHLHQRATNQRHAISLHGVGHGDFHNGGGSSVASGPCLVGRANTHTIMRGYILPFMKMCLEGNIPAKDFMWRQWEGFRPIGAPLSGCVVVDLQWREGAETGKFVIDDFETNPSPALASSGFAVSNSLNGYAEGRMDDANTNFTVNAGDTWNGFTQANATDPSRGAVFSFGTSTSQFLAYDIPDTNQDWTGFKYLSFRACQVTRDVNTNAKKGDLAFEIELTDGSGNTGGIRFANYGGGIEEPYQRTGCGGSGPGWANEFEVIRVRLTDVFNTGVVLDFTDIEELRFSFGDSHGDAVGKLGLDEIELTLD